MSEGFDPVTIPKWGIEMTHGTIVAWHKEVGDTVSAGEEIVDIETDKIVNSFEARTAGTLVRILGNVGDELPVGQLIGIIVAGAASDGAIEDFIASHSNATTALNDAPAEAEASREASSNTSVVARITPALRRKLAKAGIDPEQVAGTGPNGRIIKADVDRALEAGPGEQDSDGRPAGVAATALGGQPLSSQQATVARKLSHAQSTLPLYHVTMEADVEVTLASLSGDTSLNDVIVAAVQQALAVHPELNQTFDGDRTTTVTGQPVAIAVATEGNVVMAPVVQTPSDASLNELALDARERITRARAGQMTSADQVPAAITVSNLGMYGVTAFTAMVTPPQIMVLSVGAVRRIPVFNEADEVVARSIMTLTLGSDHRVVNGAQAAAFLKVIVSRLESH